MQLLLSHLSDWLRSTPTVFDLILWYREMTPAEIGTAIGVLVGTVIRNACGRVAAFLVLAWWRGEAGVK